MKVTKYNNKTKTAIWYVHKQLVNEGKIIYLGNGSKKGEPDWNKTIRSEFYNMDLYRSDEEEMEDFLSYLSDEVEIEEGDRGFDMPLPDSTREYFVIFDDKIRVYFYFADEYMGMGDSSQFVKIESILVPEGTDIEEVREVKDWLIKGGFKLLR